MSEKQIWRGYELPDGLSPELALKVACFLSDQELINNMDMDGEVLFAEEMAIRLFEMFRDGAPPEKG